MLINPGPEPPPPEAKAGTCGACKWYEHDPPKSFSRKPTDWSGWCRNGVACIGAVLPTNRGSTCKWHEPA